jgi:hypothetical protein
MVSLLNKGYEFFSFIRRAKRPKLIICYIPIYYFLYSSIILKLVNFSKCFLPRNNLSTFNFYQPHHFIRITTIQSSMNIR